MKTSTKKYLSFSDHHIVPVHENLDPDVDKTYKQMGKNV